MGTLRRFVPRIIVLGAVMVATLAVAYTAQGGWRGNGWSLHSLYDWGHVAMVIVLAVVVIVMPDSNASVARAASGSGAVAAAVLGGAGATAVRRWFTSGGFTATAKNQQSLQLVAAAMAAAGAIAALTLLGRVWPSVRRGRLAAGVLLGGVVAVGVPFVIGSDGSSRLTTIGSHGLMYGIPWGLAAALIAVTDRWTAVAVTGVVVLHAGLVAIDDWPMIFAPRYGWGVAVTLAGVAAAWLVRSVKGSSAAGSGVAGRHQVIPQP